MKAQPSPNHRLYVKVGKPSVKRWIQPQADPDPKVWVLADDITPPVLVPAPEVKIITNEPAQAEVATDPIQSLPEISDAPAQEAAPNKKPGSKPNTKKASE
jgi:hypothetical protein